MGKSHIFSVKERSAVCDCGIFLIIINIFLSKGRNKANIGNAHICTMSLESMRCVIVVFPDHTHFLSMTIHFSYSFS